MNHQTMLATFGGLLHDAGKIAYRSGGANLSHSRRGFDFLRDCWRDNPDSHDRQAVLDCVLYHHQDALKESALPPDSLAWLIYYADNVSAAADRRKDGDSASGHYARYLPLKPVFAKLNGDHDGFVLPPPGDASFLPVPENARPWTKEDYQTVLAALAPRLARLTPCAAELNPLLLALEDTMGAVPSSTFTGDVPDISLYDHSKIAAAVAACLSEWTLAEGVTDFKQAFFTRETASRNVPAFLLYSADVSGIQKFIYTVSTKGALRSLRSRSFFLEIAMEHYIDELLNGLGLSRANLLYSGGGHCYLLLPNTARTVEILKAWNTRFNDWLLDAFGTRLYLADGWTECAANELTNRPAAKAAETESPYKAMFRRVSSAVAKKKIRRYTAEQVLRMNAGGLDDTGRECRVCGRSDTLIPDRYGDGQYLCRWCALFQDLTAHLENKTAYLLERRAESDLALPLLDGGTAYLTMTDAETARKRGQDAANLLRLYVRDAPELEEVCAARLDAGAYAAKETLDELADASKGLRRLGVCRMDVDNLGLAFVAGFERPEDPEPYRYATLSRTSAFSRQMSLFFKRHMNAILDGSAGIGADGPDSAARPLDAALVYSGGDDVFLVGAWDAAIEAAQRVQWALDKFSCGAVTISAGIGMFSPHYPIRMAAARTAKLEDASKEMDGKSAITLFDPSDGYRCHWTEFRKNVLGEKLPALRRFFDNPRNGRGNSLLYRILGLLRDSRDLERSRNRDGEPKSGKGIALARYAYLLSRLAPHKNSPEYQEYETFSRQMYDWGIRAKDRDELMIAMELYVYGKRERTEEINGEQ
ncbi:MAG: type III-A CRISPR-associated protein Cas10/Csm1 [Oscillospiraceae bacterium]|nr:type III-A CRISPR-associated protein Cas10/Csm1 [Oscillospiraceae bacterium]